MARNWLSIRVELIEGGGHGPLWPRPGRIFAAARSHSFAALATAIDDAFARWDRHHLQETELADGTRLGVPDEDDPDLIDASRTTLGRLGGGEQFLYTFDLGDQWAHLCTVATQRIDPRDELGYLPTAPLPYWGWGTIPDQYGRVFDGDDGTSEDDLSDDGDDGAALGSGPDPGFGDLPPLRPHWGPRAG